ncbi:metal ABC transporter permease [Spiribacter sp. C176]|uniref:Metal ABC transporter permease n=1 Tax=Spiribacter salilacus TaxID=2664894 RepID=A0A6N7QSX0_9GAMM|nr:metal ABC transporter permease [Spiribacter salilacus]MRH78690.1 metal ABC transporter permease [Spiribacter salilacus]
MITASIILTGVLASASAALLGTFLVLRGSAMMSDAISHSIVLGIILVWLVTRQVSGPIPILGAALAGVLTVLLTQWLAQSQLVRMDAAIGLVFPALFAAGVLLIALYAREVHIHTDTILLGEIGFVWLNTVPLAGWEIPLSIITLSLVLIANLLFVGIFWHSLKLATFDPALAAALGLFPSTLYYALMTLTSVTAVAAFDAVGAILFVAFVIVPPATAYLLTRRLWLMVCLAIGLSTAACVSGYALAVYWNVSIAGMMASMTGVWFAATLLLAPQQGLLAQLLRRRKARLEHDCRVMLAHLLTHQNTAQVDEENTQAALTQHLNWPQPHANAVIKRALEQALIEKNGNLLRLKPAGETAARELFARR